MLKISDFGLSALYGSDHNSTLLHTTCGTPNYVAPEVNMPRSRRDIAEITPNYVAPEVNMP